MGEQKLVRIIGIDPGLRRTGWGIVESDGVRLSYVDSGHVSSDADDDLAYRLRAIFEGVTSIIASFTPREAAVEETFVNDNARATLKLGQARGMALLAPAMKGLRVAEYSPNLIKKSVVGTGHADKTQIQAMVKLLLPRASFDSADEADALAIAICHANHRTGPQAVAAIETSSRTARQPRQRRSQTVRLARR
ncbi:MAG: crossover junction endodeoxyribonuclease RuvC [Filomicrobium sp.]